MRSAASARRRAPRHKKEKSPKPSPSGTPKLTHQNREHGDTGEGKEGVLHETETGAIPADQPGQNCEKSMGELDYRLEGEGNPSGDDGEGVWNKKEIDGAAEGIVMKVRKTDAEKKEEREKMLLEAEKQIEERTKLREQNAKRDRRKNDKASNGRKQRTSSRRNRSSSRSRSRSRSHSESESTSNSDGSSSEENPFELCTPDGYNKTEGKDDRDKGQRVDGWSKRDGGSSEKAEKRRQRKQKYGYKQDSTYQHGESSPKKEIGYDKHNSFFNQWERETIDSTWLSLTSCWSGMITRICGSNLPSVDWNDLPVVNMIAGGYERFDGDDISGSYQQDEYASPPSPIRSKKRNGYDNY
mmetsp:Transcript_29908/g.58643  ORF Transcript_29908/g.58643 Transcript_29908/m.58643 type:complete len:355 (+) Transcript_29908:69-1133(+)|eukprot:CAMPEP_0175147698 /NCGR_PEP_ID=MMETSP0087-20121206/16151_1 /TAXON_ID=136419 /ORGANISM="Unknown Unknown, Strain D1" /LENGTH=354 /DNA_ID=CAMNT_0016432945 /DNA_START=60 /DNA_END=1124 /DNA_ORIENTATION=+